MSRAREKISRERVASELPEGVPIALLQDLHLLTRDGDLNADARRKLKQIQHLIGLLGPALDDVYARHEQPALVDCGAGKSSLGFLLYALRVGPAGRGTITALESRPELARAAQERAARYGFERLRCVASEIAHAAPVLPERIHFVTALHACDTATDDALALAIARGADHVAVVPCCQAEVARLLAAAKPADPSARELFAHAWHRREFGSHLTNVVRALALEAHGHQVTVTELAGWEHSLKNELILGKRVKRFDCAAQERLDGLLERFAVRPALVRALDAAPAS
ncbi:MAG TPA: SAM-dependent methyltransferase [Myxococcota bacterium]|nr:SAM-dependent methyltransferase [Myxococcota bacterium]